MRFGSSLILPHLIRCAVMGVFLPTLWAQDAADRRGWASISALGEGFVVWESNREGPWRIWRRELDGSGERRISPAEADREHVCPAISPDGQWIAYLSQPQGVSYNHPKPGQTSPLRIMRADGSEDRMLVADARRISGGNRAIVWVDADRLHFLDGNRRARRFDLRDGSVSEPLFSDPEFIPNPAFTFVMDRHFLHPIDAASGSILKTGRKLEGCEPTFTGDSRWSVRMTGAGGPIDRVDPVSHTVHPLLKKGDSRMPEGRGYLYFPKVSPCGRLLTFAASPGQHDHFTSDYDLFIAPIRPDTLELTGLPVRYTFHAKTDRYPDVFLSDFPLGRHEGEAPFKVTLTTPGGASGRWQSEDAAPGSGRTFTHTYSKPGTYTPRALVNGRELRGQVTVHPSQPPAVTRVNPESPRVLVVVFDEAVEISRLRATLASGIGVRPEGLSADGKRLTLNLAADLPEKDQLRLVGVRDRAQRPNEMPGTTMPVERTRWPVSNDKLLFAFQAGEPVRLVHADGMAKGLETMELVPRGMARLGPHGALEVAQGAFEVPEAGPRLTAALKAADELTLEAVFQSAEIRQNGPARIVSLSKDTGARNLTLGQQDGQIVLRLRTPRTGGNATSPEVKLGPVALDRSQHVVVTYARGELTVYLDGKESFRASDRIQGDFSNWEPMPLTLGDEATRDRDWCGRIEGVAFYGRALTAAEVAAGALAWQGTLDGRTTGP